MVGGETLPGQFSVFDKCPSGVSPLIVSRIVWGGETPLGRLSVFERCPSGSHPLLTVSLIFWKETPLGQFSVFENCPSGVSPLILARMVGGETLLGQLSVAQKCPSGVSTSLDCFWIQPMHSTAGFCVAAQSKEQQGTPSRAVSYAQMILFCQFGFGKR